MPVALAGGSCADRAQTQPVLHVTGQATPAQQMPMLLVCGSDARASVLHNIVGAHMLPAAGRPLMCAAGCSRRLQRCNGEPVPARASQPGRLICRGDSSLPADRAGSVAAPQAQPHDPQAEGGAQLELMPDCLESFVWFLHKGGLLYTKYSHGGTVSARTLWPKRTVCLGQARCWTLANILQVCSCYPHEAAAVTCFRTAALALCMWLLHAGQSACDVSSCCVPAGCPAAKGAAGQLCKMGGSRCAVVRGPLCAVGRRVCRGGWLGP